MADLHPTIDAFLKVVQSGKKEDLIPLLAEDVLFKPPTYWKEWPGKEITARILSHVALIFEELQSILNDILNSCLLLLLKLYSQKRY